MLIILAFLACNQSDNGSVAREKKSSQSASQKKENDNNQDNSKETEQGNSEETENNFSTEENQENIGDDSNDTVEILNIVLEELYETEEDLVAIDQKIATLKSELSDNSNSSVTYKIIEKPETDNEKFRLEGPNLHTAKEISSKESFVIHIEAKIDDSFFEKSLTFSLSQSSEPATSGGAISLTKNSVMENSPVDTEIGTIVLSGDDPLGQTYILTEAEDDNDNMLFKIDGNVLKTNAIFNYERKNSYEIELKLNKEPDVVSQKFQIMIEDNKAPLEDFEAMKAKFSYQNDSFTFSMDLSDQNQDLINSRLDDHNYYLGMSIWITCGVESQSVYQSVYYSRSRFGDDFNFQELTPGRRNSELSVDLPKEGILCSALIEFDELGGSGLGLPKPIFTIEEFTLSEKLDATVHFTAYESLTNFLD